MPIFVIGVFIDTAKKRTVLCETKKFEDQSHAQMLASSMAAERKPKAYSYHPHQ